MEELALLYQIADDSENAKFNFGQLSMLAFWFYFRIQKKYYLFIFAKNRIF